MTAHGVAVPLVQGSAEALENGGYLTEEQYLEVSQHIHMCWALVLACVLSCHTHNYMSTSSLRWTAFSATHTRRRHLAEQVVELRHPAAVLSC